MSARSWSRLTALAILATALIAAAGSIDIPGVSTIFHPRVECQNSPACRAFIHEQIASALKGVVIHSSHARGHRPGGQAPPTVTLTVPPTTPDGGGNGGPHHGGGGPPPPPPNPLQPVCDIWHQTVPIPLPICP